jgi:tetratricopeptide (TPR) repeat protein
LQINNNSKIYRGMGNIMDESLRGQIKVELSSHTTEDLIDIWKQQDSEEWEPETFQIVRDILKERLGEEPEVPVEIALPRIFTLLEDCLKRQDYKQGLRECDEAIRLAPDNAEARNYRGLFHDYLGQPEKALEDYQEAVRLDPDFEDARDNLRGAQYDLAEKSRTATTGPGRNFSADSSLENQIEDNFQLMETEELLKIWRTHDIDEYTPQAFDVLREVLRGRLGDVPEITNASTLHNSLAAIQEFWEKGDNFNALNMCRKAVDESPDSPAVNYLHGLILMELGRTSESFAAFAKTVSLDPDFKDAANLLKKMEKVLNAEFRNSQAYTYLEEALEYVADEDFEGADGEIKKAKPLIPETASALTTFGEVLLAACKPYEAMEYFEKAIKINPEYSRARKGLRDARVKTDYLHLQSKEETPLEDAAEVEKQAEKFNEEEFNESQDEVEETPDWVYMDKDAIQVKGTAGHRIRSGRSGLDPVDTQMDAYRFQGGLISRLFTGHMRTHDPVYLGIMFFAGTFFLFPLPFLVGRPDFVNDFSGRITFVCFLFPLMAAGFMFYYNIVLSFLSDEPEGFEDSNDKFF